MSWHIVCRTDGEDTFEPKHMGGAEVASFTLRDPSNPNQIRGRVIDVLHSAGLAPSYRAVDLLSLAVSVYVADKRVPRSMGFDNWTRDLRLHIPVFELEVWRGVVPLIQRMLEFLTGDHWEINFRTRPSSWKEKSQKGLPSLWSSVRTVALLSGGLDSFVNAIDQLEQGRDHIVFVSHYGAGSVTKVVQNQIYELLGANYGQGIPTLQFFLEPPWSITGQAELSSRSRSILYLSLGVIVASALEAGVDLLIPENGYMSLNVPLSPRRIGSLSTRTTHPHFLNMFQQLADHLGIQVHVFNPFRFRTKGEMMAKVRNKAVLEGGILQTMSCPNSARLRYKGHSPYTHCGWCIPCLIRRAATSKAGVSDVEYVLDIRKQSPEPYTDEGKDLRALKIALEKMQHTTRPRILDVMAAGPLPGSPGEIQQYVGVYERGMEELQEFLSL